MGIFPYAVFVPVFLAREEDVTDGHEHDGTDDQNYEHEDVTLGTKVDKVEEVEEEHPRDRAQQPEPRQKTDEEPVSEGGLACVLWVVAVHRCGSGSTTASLLASSHTAPILDSGHS